MDLAEHPGVGARSGVAPTWRDRWPAASAVLLLLSLAAVYVGWPRQAPAVDSGPMQIVPLTSLSGQVRYPALSPDGDLVAFTWTGTAGENTDIYVQQIGAGSPLRLTTDAAVDSSPAWSPDGRAIAFLRRVGTSNTHELRTVPPLGGPERKIVDLNPVSPIYRSLTVAWCPGSACLIAPDGQGPEQSDALFAFELDGGRRQLTFPEASVGLDTDPAVSPDGRSLVFRRDRTPFTGDMYQLALGANVTPAGEPALLTDYTLSATRPAWMPDSRDIVFSAKGGLWRMEASKGSTPARLPFVGLDGSQPAVSIPAAGTPSRLVYVRVFTDTNIWRADVSDASSSPHAEMRQAVASTRSDHFPAVSPDGKRLAFFSSRSGELELWVGDVDGANATQLTSLKSVPGFPRWSPDSQTLTFHSDPEGHPDVLTISANGGTPRIATPGATSGAFPSFSRDGQSLYFAGPGPEGPFRIWKVAAAGGTPTAVTETPGDIPVESYSGSELFFVESAVRPSTLWRVPLSRGAPARLVDGVLNGAFDVTEQGVYYMAQQTAGSGISPWDSRGGGRQLQYYAFATGKTVMVADRLGPTALGLSASRDGRLVYLARIDASADELMLVDDFR